MNNFQIYLAGGMQGLTMEQQNGWRERLKVRFRDGKYTARYNVAVVSPPDYYTYQTYRYDTQREVLDFDLFKLRRSDLVIVSFNAPKSLGTMAEIAIAFDRGIPVIGFNENDLELHPWQIEMCNKILYTEDDLVDYINEFYLR